MEAPLIHINTNEKNQAYKLQAKLPSKYYRVLMHIMAHFIQKELHKMNVSEVVAYCITVQLKQIKKKPAIVPNVDLFNNGRGVRGHRIQVRLPGHLETDFERVRGFLIGKLGKNVTPIQAIAWCLDKTGQMLLL